MANDMVTPEASAFGTFQSALQADPAWAWGWHCNIAVPLMDILGASHEDANKAAAQLMLHLFGVDITAAREFKALEQSWAALSQEDRE